MRSTGEVHHPQAQLIKRLRMRTKHTTEMCPQLMTLLEFCAQVVPIIATEFVVIIGEFSRLLSGNSVSREKVSKSIIELTPP